MREQNGGRRVVHRRLALDRPRPNKPLARKLALPLAAVFYVSAACAEDHRIATRGSQWNPIVTFIEAGDSVVFVGMASHETELVAGLHPDGAELWGSELDEEGFRVTFDTPGAYIYKCHVHLNAGMIGAIVVGSAAPSNLDAIDIAVESLGAERRAVQRVVARMKREIDRRIGE